MKFVRSMCIGVAFVGTSAIASATIAFNNFGPGSGGFEWGGGTWFIGKFNDQSPFRQGFQFTSSASGIVSSIYVALTHLDPPQNGEGTTPTFDLFTDDGSDGVGSLLGTWTGSSVSGDEVQLLTGGSASLTASTKYWLVAREPDSSLIYGWGMNNQGGSGLKAFSSNDGASYSYGPETQGAFRIDVTPQSVPEPFTMALMGGAAVAAFRRVRLRRA